MCYCGECRWTDSENETRYTMLHSGHNTYHIYRAAIIIKKEATYTLIECETTYNHLITARHTIRNNIS